MPMLKRTPQRAHGLPKPSVRIRLKKNDLVKVIAGKDKGKTGRVIEVNRETGRIVVEGVMMLKRHVRPNPQKGVKGGVAEKEGTIHASNVMLLTSGGVATRIGIKVDQVGDKVRRARISRKTGEMLDKK